jgi:hypothetical protein
MIQKRDRTEPPENNNQRKLSKRKLEVPTQDEQKQLQQVDIVLKNSLLNLECRELVSEMHEKVSDVILTDDLITWFQQFKKDVSGVSKKYSLHERCISFEWVKSQHYRGLENGLSNDYTSDESDSLQFPSIVYLNPTEEPCFIGSYCNNTMTSPYLNVDIAITIPEGIIEQRYSSSFSE